MFLHGMGSGSCLSYTGLVLPEHTSQDSNLVFLSEPQVIFDFLNTDDIWYIIWWICRQTGLCQWAPWHSALEFFWVLVPVNDLAGSCPSWYILYIIYIIYALIVIFSIVIDENSGQFQENDVYCEQFGANALLHSPFLRSQFSNFDRYWVFFF